MVRKAKEGDKRTGNQFWKARSKNGRGKIFETPEILWKAACEYFEWVNNNPLKEEMLFHSQGVVVKENANKMRAMTLDGLCIFMDVQVKTFWNYCNEENKSYKDFLQVTTRIQGIIRTQKFEGASAGLLNANIIARDLGLVDKKELDNKGTIQYKNVSKQFPEK